MAGSGDIFSSGEIFDIFPIYPSVSKNSDESNSSSGGLNGWSNYPKGFSTVVEFRKIQDRILLDLGLTMYDSLPELIGNDVEKGMKYLKDLIERSIRTYSQYYPEKMEIQIKTGNNSYTFIDNFDKYLNGEIKERDVILVPIGTPFHKTAGTFSSANNWYYKKPTLFASEYSGAIPPGTWGYFAAMPYKVEIGPDNEFTEDSALYSTDDMRSQDLFHTFLNLNVAKVLRRTIMSLSIGGNIEVMPHLDITIQELEQEVQIAKRQSSSHLSYMWRK